MAPVSPVIDKVSSVIDKVSPVIDKVSSGRNDKHLQSLFDTTFVYRPGFKLYTP